MVDIDKLVVGSHIRRIKIKNASDMPIGSEWIVTGIDKGKQGRNKMIAVKDMDGVPFSNGYFSSCAKYFEIVPKHKFKPGDVVVLNDDALLPMIAKLGQIAYPVDNVSWDGKSMDVRDSNGKLHGGYDVKYFDMAVSDSMKAGMTMHKQIINAGIDTEMEMFWNKTGPIKEGDIVQFDRESTINQQFDISDAQYEGVYRVVRAQKDNLGDYLKLKPIDKAPDKSGSWSINRFKRAGLAEQNRIRGVQGLICLPKISDEEILLIT